MPRKCCQTKPMDSRLETLQSVAVPVVAGDVAAQPDQPMRHSPPSDRPMRIQPLSRRRRPMGKFHAEAQPTEEELLTARLRVAAAKVRRGGAAANRRGEPAAVWIGERRQGVGCRRDTTHLVRPTAGDKVCGHFLLQPGGYNQRCRLSWLTNSALVYEPICGGGGRCGVPANEYSCPI
jgi:hypothetical protein